MRGTSAWSGLAMVGGTRADESKAIDALKKVGARISQDDKQPGKLFSVNLGGTKVTDADLAHLKGLANLQELVLDGARVIAAGVGDLQRALPRCRISH
jgi:hypothetical protein